LIADQPEADSYYEYLIKEHQLLGGGNPQYARMYVESIESMYEHLVSEVKVVPDQQLLVIGEKSWETYTPTLAHLVRY